MSDVYQKDFDLQFAVLMSDWDKVNDSIHKFDDLIFRVRGISIAATSAVVAYSFSKSMGPMAPLFMTFPVFLFWLMDGLLKLFQHNFINRDREIRSYMSSPNLLIDRASGSMKYLKPAGDLGFQKKKGVKRWWISKSQLKLMTLRNSLWCFVPQILILCAVAIWLSVL